MYLCYEWNVVWRGQLSIGSKRVTKVSGIELEDNRKESNFPLQRFWRWTEQAPRSFGKGARRPAGHIWPLVKYDPL